MSWPKLAGSRWPPPAQEADARQDLRLRWIAQYRGRPGTPRDDHDRDARPGELDRRNRAINSIGATGAKLIELGDLAERVAAIEAATKTRRSEGEDVFPAEGLG